MLLEAHGIETPSITGASSGSYAADAALPYFTELQAGSYALMDGAYARIGGVDFGHALTVLATVISANHADRVTVDAGFKAFATDRPFGPDVVDIPGARYGWAGDEFGYVFFDHSRIDSALGIASASFLRTAILPSISMTASTCVMVMRSRRYGR